MKRLFAILCTLIMMLVLVPASALAAGEGISTREEGTWGRERPRINGLPETMAFG